MNGRNKIISLANNENSFFFSLTKFVHRCTEEFRQLFPVGFNPKTIKRAGDLLKLKLVNPLIRKYIPDFLKVYPCERFKINGAPPVESQATSLKRSDVLITLAILTTFRLFLRNM
jgi:hypothetical protein